MMNIPFNPRPATDHCVDQSPLSCISIPAGFPGETPLPCERFPKLPIPIRQQCILHSYILHPVHKFPYFSLRVGVDLSPDLLNLLALDFRLLAVGLGSLEPLGAEAHIDGVLGLVAHADGLVEESASVALFKGVHNLLAGCVAVVSVDRTGKRETAGKGWAYLCCL